MSEYKSFLICFHKTQTDIYKTGRPIGKIQDGVLIPDDQKLSKVADLEFIDEIQDVLNKLREDLKKEIECKPQ